ncbi:MAG: hypothetical protein KME15_07320 [Drouetiella hepatica Uher 2000/2452]|uniref:Uncharacterized protein n=1 Tax=Drouetiella hepatica Uher 2000/2452 TaxID=904376 RepID=A0A951Q818_9CYAN|nr:hypothetical protein [Drouetiella hepatica Uher 2000/2452]
MRNEKNELEQRSLSRILQVSRGNYSNSHAVIWSVTILILDATDIATALAVRTGTFWWGASRPTKMS